MAFAFIASSAAKGGPSSQLVGPALSHQVGDLLVAVVGWHTNDVNVNSIDDGSGNHLLTLMSRMNRGTTYMVVGWRVATSLGSSWTPIVNWSGSCSTQTLTLAVFRTNAGFEITLEDSDLTANGNAVPYLSNSIIVAGVDSIAISSVNPTGGLTLTGGELNQPAQSDGYIAALAGSKNGNAVMIYTHFDSGDESIQALFPATGTGSFQLPVHVLS